METVSTMIGRLAALCCLALALSACDDGPAGLESQSAVTVLLTDAPGDVVHAWVDIREIYLQGGGDGDEENTAGGRTVLFTGPTGPLDLLALVENPAELGTVIVPARRYGQLRVVIDGAAVELEGGEVYATDGFVPPGNPPITGELVCPSCSTAGFHVLLQGRELDLVDPEELLVLDFDAGESFARQAGMSDRWILTPVIKLFDDPAETE